MHKMRAHFLFHALPRRPSKGYPEYTEREYALIGRTSTHLSLWIENLDVFRGNDLLALMLNCLCHSALAGGGRGATALPISVTRDA